jgi:hypothetical protein
MGIFDKPDTMSDLCRENPTLAKYDWQKIKEEYIHAPDVASRPTLDELAAKYGCAPSHLREKAGKEDWRLEAERYLETVADKRQEKRSTALSGDLAEWDTKCFKAAQAGLGLLAKRLQKKIEETTAGGESPSFSTLDDMAKALERLQKIGRAALGEKDNAGLTLKIDYSQLSDEQLGRIAAGDDPRDVVTK